MILAVAASVLVCRPQAPRFAVTIGEPKTLLPPGSLGLEYFPDMAVAALQTKPSMRLLVAAGISTYLLEGADIEHLTRAEKVLSPGPPGAFDNGYVGVAGVYRHRDGSWYAFYHAEDQEDMPPIPGGIPGFFASVGAAISKDDGRTWRKLGQILTSAKPKGWTAYPGQADRGVGEPCVAPDRTGKYVFGYYTDHSRVGGRGVQICMARAPLPPVDGAWRKLREGAFAEPGLAGADTPVVSARHLDQADAMMPFVVYSAGLRTFIMVLNVNCWKELRSGTAPSVSGVYVCYSGDGTHWSGPEKLFTDWAIARIGQSVSWHPSILWDTGSTSEGWLIYSHSERWGHRDKSGIPHYMVGRRIRFRRDGS